MIVCVGPSEVTRGSTAVVEAARATFDARHGIVIPGLLAATVVERCQRRISGAPVRERVHDELDPPARDLEVLDAVLHDELHFLLNDDRLIDVVSRITGVRPIGNYNGVVRSHIPGQGHDDTWHDDVGDDIVLTMTINLSDGVYRGGHVQVRERASGRVTFDETATGVGDALVFGIGPDLEHRVTRMEGSVVRTVLSGWFRSRPSYRDELRNRFAEEQTDLP